MSNQSLLKVDIPASWAGKTLASFLKNYLNLSRTRVRILKKTGGILINGDPVWVTYQLKGGELLELVFPRLVQNIRPESLSLSIIYEDNDLIVVDKPAGQVVHPVHRYQSGTLANAVIQHWRQTGADYASFHPVHRLDRLTSGLVLIAKSPWVHQQMAVQLNKQRLRRLYLAVCKGVPPQKSGKINLPVSRLIGGSVIDNEPPAGPGVKWVVDHTGKPAITRYRVLKNYPDFSLLAVKLFTGRTHQIRIHLSHLGIPLWGDPLYGF